MTPTAARGASLPLVGGGMLLAVYLATLAPTVTLWDSGEFLAAIKTLGVPHPPGTPLFILVARAWASLLAIVPFALAVNAASAAATAAACTLLGLRVSRWTSRPLAGFLATVAAGTMAAVWQSATETEVYAYSLLLVTLALVAADRAGGQWSDRHRLLVAYLFGVAVPLHISALVAAPAIIYLCATDAGGVTSWRATLLPIGAFCVATGVGTVAIAPLLVGAVLILAGASLLPNAPMSTMARGGRHLAVVLLGASVVVFMLVRAGFDPPVNQGDPSTWESLLQVVGRRQYDVPPLWPRRAPLWLQLGNVGQYADWQVAWSLDDWPGFSWRRTPLTLLFVALAAVGSLWHRRIDRRSWRALGLLLLSASVGVVVVLNLRAGPSYGFGILAADAIREARERDYFFSLAFAVWGVWGGCGAAALVERSRLRLFALLALVPFAANWSGVDRRRAPEVRHAEVLGETMLRSLPARAVLIVAGDNDTYPLWFAQQVHGVRRDVTVVTIPLLAAGWYREELRRRHDLLAAGDVRDWSGEGNAVKAVAAAARRVGRPLAASVSVDATTRSALDARWSLVGLAYVEAPMGARLAVDSTAVRQTTEALRAGGIAVDRDAPRESAARYVDALFRCPEWALAGDSARTRPLLESTCNYR